MTERWPQFNIKKDIELINAGTHFWCKACQVARPLSEKSPDPRYCQGCYELLLKEAELEGGRRAGEWRPKKGKRLAEPSASTTSSVITVLPDNDKGCDTVAHGERNALLIKLLFDGCLRVSEALGVRPVDLQRTPDGWVVKVMGKGNKPGLVAISASIAAELQSYCYRARIAEPGRIFPVSRSQAFRIVGQAFDKAGIRRPSKERDHVGAVHILRHSGAIERLRLTGNPRAVQHQLRHKSALMTMQYLKTLSADESLKIQQGVELW